MKIMGLDVGSKTIGVAVSDDLGWTAQGIETVKINEAAGQFGFKRIIEIAEEHDVSKIIIGLPKNMNNSLGPRAEASQRYGDMLGRRVDAEIVYWDERLSTMAAERVLLEADMSRGKRKKVIDKMAAVMILQGYLDSNTK
ncbi:holliday junction resolvase [Jeotgalibacillus alimentarius]|uniref:Putative pre-16S rRNA nuclease n=1 Tax=Jeotgalibacillus alimentarius TaxID=135826 RepID=A0A0C2SHE3_9BACL|nr:Holliday junction resolvase RuvX [Jeotgalibacillus alimentarius]KIL53389.1 holliday junction resolvase [Jeotgalibacillus alimentarius]